MRVHYLRDLSELHAELVLAGPAHGIVVPHIIGNQARYRLAQVERRTLCAHNMPS
jgi:hypothetical protein